MPLSLSSYSRDHLEKTLHILKLYRISLKQIGKRASLLDPHDLPRALARIEYAPGMDKKTLEKYATACLMYSFPLYQNKESPVFIENPSLGWWVRVFVSDDMVDISLSRFTTLLQN